jgi:1,4-alpha-glucan branching enzyme
LWQNISSMGGTLPGLDDCGAHISDDGVRFCVWAPFADKVAVTGDFTNWSDEGLALSKGGDDCWYADVQNAEVGQEYKYLITHGGEVLWRNDPRALQLTASEDSSVLVDPKFDWAGDSYKLPPAEEVVIYELHVGTFVRNDPTLPGTFHDAMTKLDYLVDLGVNVIEIMPCNAVWMDRWWGYTPDNIYAVEAAYGGRRALMEFVKAAHQRGLGVILDVVYNHLNKDSGLDLWQFDGWSEQDDKGGIYFYSDARSHTPWGETRPDFGRAEVRKYIVQNAEMWLRDYHIDGLRVDSVIQLRNTEGKNNDPEHDLPDGWKLLQEMNDGVRKVKPQALTIAEDLQGNEWITKPTKDGGAGFGAQWDPAFGGILREELGPQAHDEPNIEKMRLVVSNLTNGNPFERVIFMESHDTDAGANGGKRFDEAIAPGEPASLRARKRTALATAVLFTSPGIPMLFQGQEFEEAGAFAHYIALDWSKADEFQGILKLHKHLIALRLNRYKNTAGLLGSNVDIFSIDKEAKVVAYHRWDKGGRADDVVVVVNFSGKPLQGYELSFPATGKWWVRLNTDWKGYGEDFGDLTVESVEVKARPDDAKHFIGKVTVPAQGVLIFSQDL